MKKYLIGLTALFLSVFTAAGDSATSPSSVLSQLGVSGVTAKIQGTNAALYANYLIKTDTNGLMNVTMLPASISPTIWNQMLFIDGTRGSDSADYRGTVTAPYKTLTNALAHASNNTVFVLAPGVYGNSTILTNALTNITIVGQSPETTWINGFVRFDNDVNASINLYGVKIDQIWQNQYKTLTVGLYNRTYLNGPITRIGTNNLCALQINRDPSTVMVSGWPTVSTTYTLTHDATNIAYQAANTNIWWPALYGDVPLNVTAALEGLASRALLIHGTTPGQVPYWNGTNWNIIAAATNTYVLHGGTNPVFSAVDATNVVYTPASTGQWLRFATAAPSNTMDALDRAAIGVPTRGTAEGQVLYWNGTNWIPVAAGATNQILYGGTMPGFKNLAVTFFTNNNIPFDFVPYTNGVYSIGSPSLQWLNGYFSNAVYVDGNPALTNYTETDPVFTAWADSSAGINAGNGSTATNHGVALGATAWANNRGTAIGGGAEGTDDGVGVGQGAEGRTAGVAVGASANASGTNVAVGYTARASDSDGMHNTAEIGAGTATNSGWLHYRGVAVVDSTGNYYGPTGNFSVVKIDGNNALTNYTETDPFWTPASNQVFWLDGRYAGNRSVWGQLDVTNMSAGSFGCAQFGVGTFAGGGDMKMPDGAVGCLQLGYCGNIYVPGNSTMTMGGNTWGAMQLGAVYSGNGTKASATNYANGSLQLLDLYNKNALTTANGDGSILMGAGVASNRYAIVAGDGQESHGNGSVSALGGFWDNGTRITNTVEVDTLQTVIDRGAVATNCGIVMSGLKFDTWPYSLATVIMPTNSVYADGYGGLSLSACTSTNPGNTLMTRQPFIRLSSTNDSAPSVAINGGNSNASYVLIGLGNTGEYQFFKTYADWNGNSISNVANIVPYSSNAYSLGTAALPWSDLYLGSNSIYMNGTKVMSMSSNGTDLIVNVPVVTTNGTPLNPNTASYTPYIMTYAFSNDVSLSNGNFQYYNPTAETTIYMPTGALNQAHSVRIDVNPGANPFSISTHNVLYTTNDVAGEGASSIRIRTTETTTLIFNKSVSNTYWRVFSL